jgi:opacity protein-like surface antigen
MLKTFTALGLFAAMLGSASFAHAQALPTATGRGSLQAGVGVTLAEPDYGQKSIKGISGFITFDFTPHFGVEAVVHYVALVTPTDLAENTFLIGPRYVYRKGRFNPYAKLLIGRGDLVIQETNDNPGRYSGNYLAFALGAGLDIDITHHLVVRAIDVEYQRWPNLGNGLSPIVATVGVAYRFR